MDKPTTIADRLDAMAAGLAESSRTGFTVSPVMLHKLANDLRAALQCHACQPEPPKEKSSNDASHG